MVYVEYFYVLHFLRTHILGAGGSGSQGGCRGHDRRDYHQVGQREGRRHVWVYCLAFVCYERLCWRFYTNGECLLFIHYNILSLATFSQVAASGQGTRMRNFKDTNLKNSRFFLELVYALEPRAVDFAMVNNGLDHDSFMSNAKVGGGKMCMVHGVWCMVFSASHL
ncbi:hypothetical protein EON63_19505 [archaeon]|nr:MAG: hypothetical protein EON63_19505 [archaeon]